MQGGGPLWWNESRLERGNGSPRLQVRSDRSGTAFDIKLPIDRAEVGLHSVLSNSELLGDFGVAKTAGQTAKHFLLTECQPAAHRSRCGPDEGLDDRVPGCVQRQALHVSEQLECLAVDVSATEGRSNTMRSPHNWRVSSVRSLVVSPATGAINAACACFAA